MSSFNLPRYTKEDREHSDLAQQKYRLTPFRALSAIYEILEQHLIANDPATLGYAFTQRYSSDYTKSNISLQINYNWKAEIAGKRPAIYLARGHAELNNSLLLGQSLQVHVPSSREERLGLISMPVTVTILANGIGFAEEFADYVKYPFMYFAKEISREYCFKKFRLARIARPEVYTPDGKDCFMIELTLIVEFYDQYTVTGDYLPLKTVHSAVVLDGEEKTF